MSATVHPLPGVKLIPHADMDEQQARAITDQIQSSVADLAALIVQAFRGRAWLALGYPSWVDYIRGEFRNAPLHLHRDDRRAVVELLRGHGMSQRAIADAAGVGVGTVNRDLAARVPSGTPDAAGATAVPVTTIGLDGKTYQRPPEKAPRKRRPLPDAYRDHVRIIGKQADALVRLFADDRFARHRGTLRDVGRGDLMRARDALDRAIQALEKETA